MLFGVRKYNGQVDFSFCWSLVLWFVDTAREEGLGDGDQTSLFTFNRSKYPLAGELFSHIVQDGEVPRDFNAPLCAGLIDNLSYLLGCYCSDRYFLAEFLRIDQ